MPIYHSLGKIPHKRHTVFKNGKDRYFYEQLFGTIGFDGMSSLLYHVHRPTMVKELRKPKDLTPKIAVEKNMRALRLHGFKTRPEKDHLAARKAILVNSDVAIVLAGFGMYAFLSWIDLRLLRERPGPAADEAG